MRNYDFARASAICFLHYRSVQYGRLPQQKKQQLSQLIIQPGSLPRGFVKVQYEKANEKALVVVTRLFMTSDWLVRNILSYFACLSA